MGTAKGKNSMGRVWAVFLILLGGLPLILWMSSCSSAPPSGPANTPTFTLTATYSPTITDTPTITNTPTITFTPTITYTPTTTFTPTHTFTACPYTQGKTSIGASSVNAPNHFFFTRFAPSSSFTANYLHYHVTSGATGYGAMAIYANDTAPGPNGGPSTVLAKTLLVSGGVPVHIPVKDGWNDLPIASDRFDNPISNIALSAGVTYWLAFVTSGNCQLSYDNVGGYYSTERGVWTYPNFNLDPWNSGNYTPVSNYDLSLYASDCP
jgi:hypothetical protein